MRKYLIVTFIAVLPLNVAYATETAKPMCGKTVEECQKIVDDTQKQLTTLQEKAQKALSVYKQLLSEANDRLAAAAQ